MAFNRTMDKQVKNIVVQMDGQEIHIGVYSYNGGDEKIQIGRLYEKKDGGMGHRKLGRLTLDEAVAVRNALDEILAEAGVND